jgi:hypothetical protein
LSILDRIDEHLNEENPFYKKQWDNLRAAQKKYFKALSDLKKVADKTQARELKEFIDVKMAADYDRLDDLISHFDVAFGDIVKAGPRIRR